MPQGNPALGIAFFICSFNISGTNPPPRTIPNLLGVLTQHPTTSGGQGKRETWRMGFAHQQLPSQVPGLRVGLCAPAEGPEGPAAGGTEARLEPHGRGTASPPPARELGAGPRWAGAARRGGAVARRRPPGGKAWAGGGGSVAGQERRLAPAASPEAAPGPAR